MKLKLTIEESARLINEFGISKELADIVSANEPYYPDDVEFSLDTLLSILPKKITDRRDIFNLTIGATSEDSWYAKYINDLDGWDSLNSYQEADELCDCIYDMIVWLKTNKVTEL